MPIPKRKEDEDKSSFMARCMSDSVMNKDYPDNSQRYAVCMGAAKGSQMQQVQDQYYENTYGSTEELTEDNMYFPEESDYVDFGEASEEWDVAKERPGLWENIRKKKEREGKKYKPAKPGDKDRPDPDAWKKAQSKYKYKDIETNEIFLYDRMGVYRRNGRVLTYIGKAGEDSYMQTSQIKKMSDQLSVLSKIVDNIPVEFQEWTKDHISKAEYYIQAVYDAILYPTEKEKYEVEKPSEVETTDDIESAFSSEYQGRKVTLNKPFRTPKGPKKFSVYVKNEKGNVVKVNFGDPNMEIKRDNPARRKSFRARHQCDTNPGPRWRARYWSCKMW